MNVKLYFKEITIIPEILAGINLEDAVVSIDTMGTRREIAELIVHSGGHYLLAVKKNQRSLYEDTECDFRVMACTDFHEEPFYVEEDRIAYRFGPERQAEHETKTLQGGFRH